MAFDWSGAISGAYKQAQSISKNWMDRNNSGSAPVPAQASVASNVSDEGHRPSRMGGRIRDVVGGLSQQLTQRTRISSRGGKRFLGGHRPRSPKKTPYQQQGTGGPARGSNIRYRGA